MTNKSPIRFEANGPNNAGLERWEEMNPEELASGTPVQNGHTYHEIEEEGYIAGVWDCTAFTDHMGNYSVDEFMWLLEGTVIMRMPDGEEVHVNAGEAFVIPKGLECQWDMPGYVRKFFMILDGPVPETGANPSLQRVTVPDLSAIDAGDAVESRRVDFMNAAGTMQVDVASLGASVTPDYRADAHELIHVLDGALVLGGERYAKGDTAYLTQGTVLSRETETGTRLLTSRYKSS